jgi:hypothetical protein
MKWNRTWIGILAAGVLLSFVAGTALAKGPEVRRASDGSEYTAGWLCVKLQQSLRDQLSGTLASNGVLLRTGVLMRNGILLTPNLGVSSVDGLNAKYRVTKIERLDPNPNPIPAIKQYGVDMIFTVHLDPALDLEQVAKEYKGLPEVEDAYPSPVYRVDFTPNDPRLSSQWALPKIGALQAYDITHGDSTQASVWVVDPDIGLDWHHEDITNGLWINGPEDINHNGRFDLGPPPNGDQDGIDQDGDGYIDDVIGWDWMQNDDDPSPNDPVNDIHGTHTWGCCMAQTNNGLGVASPGYRTHGMGTNTGTGGYIYYGYNALAYGANKGAKVATMSWGGGSNNQSAIDAAWAAGMNCVAAAGNGGGIIISYPGADNHVTGAMSSGPGDMKSSFSNYNGTSSGQKYYDVCAPGENILSTLPGNTYGQESGTSMSTPTTAGIIAMMRSFMPSKTNDQIDTILYHTCDTMPDPLYHSGQLGWGRVNEWLALGSGVRTYLTFLGSRIDDRMGNNNGIADPGETVGLIVRLANAQRWQTATSVSATITTTDTSVSIVKGTATWPNINAGSNAECSADSFSFMVGNNTLPHRVTFWLHKSASPPTVDTLESFTVPVVKPKILLVKDDAGANYDTWYRTPLATLNALADTYNVAQQGSPSGSLLTQYPVVFWWTGNDSTTTLLPADTAALKAFLDGGGKLFITGQNIGQDIASKYPAFYANYLRANFLQPSSGNIILNGVDGDPIGQSSGDTLALAGGGGAQNAHSNDVIAPVGGAQAAFMYRGTTSVAGITYAGSYRLVYFAFPAEAIGGTAPRYVQRTEIIRRILAWFGGTLGVENPQEAFRLDTSARDFTLGAFAPNPLVNGGGIEFSLPRTSGVDLGVYNLSGQRIRILASGERPAGRYLARWDGKDETGKPVASGVYLCRLQAGGFAQTRNVVVLR